MIYTGRILEEAIPHPRQCVFIRIKGAKMDTYVTLLEIPVDFLYPKITGFEISGAFLIAGGK